MQSRHIIELGNSGELFNTGDGELLLDSALEQGMSIPFSCRRGECGCCKVKVISGEYEITPYQGLGTPYALADGEALLCQSRACSDMQIDIPGWSFEARASRFEATIVEKELVSNNVARLLVRPDPTLVLGWRPGQYAKIYLDNGSSRCFSVANLPADDDGFLEFQIRRVAGGYFSEKILDALVAGDKIDLEGGFGSCTWQPSEHSHLVLFATGTGYAGIKPILLSALAERRDSPQWVTLYWGGREVDDFYDRAALDMLASTDARFRWVGVLGESSLPADGYQIGHVQQIAATRGHAWNTTRVYACGNPAMISATRIFCREQGVAETDFIAEAFVASGASPVLALQAQLDPVWEKVGPGFSLEAILAAREQSKRAVYEIAGKLRVGMSTAQAVDMANVHLKQMGASHTWHPTYIRFGDDTVRSPRQGVDKERTLQSTDIVVVDIGPVWNGYEGDFGDTFVFGNDHLHLACAEAARDVFAVTKRAWTTGLTGKALYDHAEAHAACNGWVLERNLAGHRISDFPHALYGPARLAEMDIVPSEMVWVLEIQLRHPTIPIAAFYEDILIQNSAAIEHAN